MEEEETLNRRYQIKSYLDHARHALNSAASSLEHGFYDTAINRAYYAIFYAASGLLLTEGISRITFESDRPLAEKALDVACRFVERIAVYLLDREGIQT